MTQWETLNCFNHPERIALERCEICQKPLCAYCLYYTEDGQRLCEDHAAQARTLGVRVEDPGAYAEQLLGAQVGAARKHKRGEIVEDKDLYKGNQNDLMGLVGLVISMVAMSACCGAIYCLPLVGLGLSLIAVINAKRAYDPRRTRRLGLLGTAVSGVWVLIVGGCIFFYGLSLSTAFSSFSNFNWVFTSTPFYVQVTDTPTFTPEPSRVPFTPRTSAPADETTRYAAPHEDSAAAEMELHLPDVVVWPL